MEENKNYCSREDDEIEVNLRLMFYNGLKNWRKLLLAGLLFGLLFGAGKGIKAYRAGQAERAVEALPKKVNPYESELDKIELPEYMQAKKTSREETIEIPDLPQVGIE